MTNKLLSEEELLEKIEGIAKYLGCNDMELANEIMPLINTQKRLYAESIIGKDEHYDKSDPLYELSGEPFEWAERNQLRAEQRARIK